MAGALVADSGSAWYSDQVRRKLLTRVVAVLLVWQLMPGIAEIVENAVHLAREGHLAHAPEDAEHRSSDAEHDCSGPYHFCVCHVSTPFVVAHVASATAPPAPSAWAPATIVGAVHPGYGSNIFRPPIA